jgi:bifunctional DNA-binding transcriptional regulator/antitoxin component of YhaV-PrlF toxin-antitoxin module
MTTSTLTGKGQTTVPLEIRQALGIAPRQRLVWELRRDGSAVVRAIPSVMELAGCMKSEIPFTSLQDETEAATDAWVDESTKSVRR